MSATLNKQTKPDSRICVATVGKPFHLKGLFHLLPPREKMADLSHWVVDPAWKKLWWTFQSLSPQASAIPAKVTHIDPAGNKTMGLSAFKSSEDVQSAVGAPLYVETSKLWKSSLPQVKILAFEGLPLADKDGTCFANTKSGHWIQRSGILFLQMIHLPSGESAELPLDWPHWGAFFESTLTSQEAPTQIQVSMSEEKLWENLS